MAKGDVALVAGIAGFVLGGVAVFLGGKAGKEVGELRDEIRNTNRQDEESFAGMGGKLVNIDEANKELQRRINDLDPSKGSRADRLAQIEERLAALEAARGDTPVAPPANGGGPKSPDPFDDEKFKSLQDKVFSGEATTDEQAAFWEMLREKPEILAGIMKRLEKKVADNPRDHDARMALSRAYLAKLFTVPAGPEQGTWSMKAMDQYTKILAEDPNHWEARYSLAFNYSQWPDFLNKRPDAIREFETLKKQQEDATPKPEHAQTYLQLRQLYLKDGRTDDARSVLEEGLRRFPDDAELKKAAGK